MLPDHQVNVKVKEWLSGLLLHRQSKTHFIPLARLQELRDLTRYHKTLIQERAQQINQLQEMLEIAKFNHSSVVSPISSTCQPESVVTTMGGEDNSQTLRELAYRHNRAKLLELCQALERLVPAHQRFLINSIISHVDFLEYRIQNVQNAIKTCFLPSKATNQLLNVSLVVEQIDDYLFFPDIHKDLDRLFYNRHLIPWIGVHPDNRQNRSKCISGTTRRHIILHELAQVIASDKDPFLALFYHRQAHRLGKKQAFLVLAHKLLTISYHILKNNKPHQELALNNNEQLDVTPLPLKQHHGYRFGPLVINCCISICLMAGLALISHSPFVFPSLGPTVFLFFYKPTDPSSSPRNILIGHAIATIAGYLSLVATGLTATGPAFVVGVTLPRIIAIGLSLGLTVGLMVLFRAPHPPATATTLIISLGTLTKPWQLLVLMLAVVLLTMQALIINRLAGIDYPLWNSQPAPRVLL